MEDNAYNREVLKKLKEINSKYLSHLEKTGKLVSDQVPLTDPSTNYGSGLFDFSPLSLLGLGKKRGRPSKKGGLIKTAGKAEPIVSGNVGRAVGSGKDKDIGGGGFFDSLESLAPLAMMALGKPKKGGKRGRPRKVKGGDIGVDAMAEQKNLLTGNGKRRVGRPCKSNNKVAGGWFDDMVSGVSKGFNMVVDPALNLAQKVAPLASAFKGKGRKTSPWISHIKAYASNHNMSYRDALRDPKAKSSYKKK